MEISERNLFLLLLYILLFLLIMHFVTLIPAIDSALKTIHLSHSFFELDYEVNLPNWYSVVLLFTVSLSSLYIYTAKEGQKHSRKFWFIFMCVYCYMSLDEAIGIHEAIERHSGYAIKWAYIYAPLALAFFIMCFYHLSHNENKVIRNRILGGLIVFATGGLLIEFTHWFFNSSAFDIIEHALEGSLEILGTSLVLMGCVHELNRIFTLNNQTKIST